MLGACKAAELGAWGNGSPELKGFSDGAPCPFLWLGGSAGGIGWVHEAGLLGLRIMPAAVVKGFVGFKGLAARALCFLEPGA